MTYKALFPAAICLALACPAVAATTTAQSGAGSANGSDASSANGSGMATPQISQKLSQSLKEAGYTNVQIVPESFMVHATDKNGNPVTMVLTPTSMTEVVAVNEPAGGAANQPGNAAGSGDHSTASQPSGASSGSGQPPKQ